MIAISFQFVFVKNCRRDQSRCTSVCTLQLCGPVRAWSRGGPTSDAGDTSGYPPRNCRTSHLFNGNLFLLWKIGPFEKIVDEIRGVFNFGVVLVCPGLDPTTPRPKIRGAAPAGQLCVWSSDTAVSRATKWRLFLMWGMYGVKRLGSFRL